MPNLIILGDSILWGQGLREEQKLTTLFRAAWAAARGPVTVHRFAHSGATIWREPAGAPSALAVSPAAFETELHLTDAQISDSPPCADAHARDAVGERPLATPFLLRQIADARAEVGQAADLVLMDFGINDTDVYNLVLPEKNNDAVVARGASLGPRMRFALERTVAAFPNAKVIVTGYYPVVSERSDPQRLRSLAAEVVHAAGQNLVDIIRDAVQQVVTLTPDHVDEIRAIDAFHPVRSYFDRITDRNRRWFAAIDAVIKATIVAVDPHGTRIRFADPRFGPEHALFAPHSLLWPGLDGLDPMRPVRDQLADDNHLHLSFFERVVIRLASTGHPNPEGAQRYAEAVRRAAIDLGLF